MPASSRARRGPGRRSIPAPRGRRARGRCGRSGRRSPRGRPAASTARRGPRTPARGRRRRCRAPRRASGSTSSKLVDQPEPVPEPGERGGRVVDDPFEAVRRPPPSTQASDVTHAAAPGAGASADVQQHRRAGAERHLRRAGLEAAVGEQRRLRVAHDAADRHRPREQAADVGLAELGRALAHLRQCAAAARRTVGTARRPTQARGCRTAACGWRSCGRWRRRCRR